jgi:hypothetical protein
MPNVILSPDNLFNIILVTSTSHKLCVILEKLFKSSLKGKPHRQDDTLFNI